jgi:hypothetical protein
MLTAMFGASHCLPTPSDRPCKVSAANVDLRNLRVLLPETKAHDASKNYFKAFNYNPELRVYTSNNTINASLYTSDGT